MGGKASIGTSLSLFCHTTRLPPKSPPKTLDSLAQKPRSQMTGACKRRNQGDYDYALPFPTSRTLTTSAGTTRSCLQRLLPADLSSPSLQSPVVAHSPPTLQSQLPNLLPGGSHTHTGAGGHRNAERGFDGNVWARWLVQVVLCGKPGFWWQLASSPALRPLHPALSLYTGSQLSHVT